ncbi:MAG: hypothetical protein PF795_15235 [Kiritimatiellae bacterium]|jgi:hypothetical protein|nr:hypothetical protein [Kiritimatiellia bacterium]
MKKSIYTKIVPISVCALAAQFGCLQASTILIDFGPVVTDPTPTIYNNVTAVTGDQADLVDITGALSGIAMNISSGGFAAMSSQGSMAADGSMFAPFQPYNVIQDYSYVNGGATGTLAFSGLDSNLTYNLTITGARNTDTERFTRYEATGFDAAVLQVAGNDPFAGTGTTNYNNNSVVSINGITGVTSFDLTVTGNQQADFLGADDFGYINVLQISVIPEPSGIVLLGLGVVVVLLGRYRR